MPTSMATVLPALRISAARAMAASSGAMAGYSMPRLEGTIMNACSGGEYGSSCTSAGMISAVGARWVIAMRIARSSTLGNCSGTVTIWT